MKTGMLVIAGVLAAQVPRPGLPAPSVDYHIFSARPLQRRPDPSRCLGEGAVALLDVAGIRKALVLSLAYQHGNPNRLRWKTRRKGQGRERLDERSGQPVHQDRLRAFCSINPLKDYSTRSRAAARTRSSGAA